MEQIKVEGRLEGMEMVCEMLGGIGDGVAGVDLVAVRVVDMEKGVRVDCIGIVKQDSRGYWYESNGSCRCESIGADDVIICGLWCVGRVHLYR